MLLKNILNKFNKFIQPEQINNSKRKIIEFEDIKEKISNWNNPFSLEIPIGIDIKNNIFKYDIRQMPHMLIAGATGSGKSSFLHNIILSLITTKKPEEVKLILVDPKKVEFHLYKDSPYLATPIITDLENGAKMFLWLVEEMKRRYILLESSKVLNMQSFNEKAGFIKVPSIVVIVDEVSTIMGFDPATIEKCIIRIAQLSKATNIYMILSTSRPSKNIYTDLIKNNISTRVAFNTATKENSEVIIDKSGAETLLGKGDMLFKHSNLDETVRLQGIYVSNQTIEHVLNRYKEPK